MNITKQPSKMRNVRQKFRLIGRDTLRLPKSARRDLGICLDTIDEQCYLLSEAMDLVDEMTNEFDYGKSLDTDELNRKVELTERGLLFISRARHCIEANSSP